MDAPFRDSPRRETHIGRPPAPSVLPLAHRPRPQKALLTKPQPEPSNSSITKCISFINELLSSKNLSLPDLARYIRPPSYIST